MEDQYFACVRFIDQIEDNEFIPVRQIKYHEDDDDHIRPEHLKDFVAHHEYEVLWCLCESADCTGGNDKCSYYKGYIICLGGELLLII